MRKTLWIGALVLAGLVAQAATNDLTTALQKGLFEEEANRNLEAAIQAYQSVANQFDKDRKLAATAIFRLGECYRKQGNTNGAVAQFERIVREFSDQSALATLSRQNLAGLGAQATGAAASPATAAARAERELTSSEAEEVKRIQALIKDSPDLVNASDQLWFTPLHKAAQFGQLVVAQFLLANGANTEAKSSSRDGRTPLHIAAWAGHKAMVELLLSKQADVKAADKDGLTPLHLAAESGYRAVAESLLAQGAPVDARNKDNSTPLLLAAAHGFKSVIELLLDHGANINAATDYIYRAQGGNLYGTALSLAVQRQDQALAEFLLAKGAAVNVVNNQGCTALSYAAQNRDEPMVKLLLAAHADPNAGTQYLPLARAAYYGNTNTLQRLLAAGADPNVKSQGSWAINNRSGVSSLSPLFLAINKHHPEAVTALIQGKANPNSLDSLGNPVLFEALTDAPTLQALLEGGADPNQRNRAGVTPLQAVAPYSYSSQPESVKMLLAHGADPNLANADGWSPLHEATANNATNVMALLLQHGADVNAKAAEGQTPLRVAVERGRLEAAKLLLENKANPNLRDNAGATALDYAKSQTPQQSSGMPGGFPRAIPRPLRIPTPGSPVTPSPEPASPATLADLLRQHGALDDLPRLDAIELRRPSARYSETLFTRDTNAPNQFTLAELVGVEYALLAGSPEREPQAKSSYQTLFLSGFRNNALPYPDLAHVRIRTPAPDLKSWRERTVSLMPLLEAGICTNLVLNWGDLVEIPEQDHALNENWSGFTRTQLENLIKCLQRQVEIVVKGQATQVTLGPKIPERAGPSLMNIEKASLWLRPVLLNSKLVLASSDLSHVKLIRRDKATGTKSEWVVDCSGATPAPNFWLQDGDVIEVPEKAQYGAMESLKR